MKKLIGIIFVLLFFLTPSVVMAATEPVPSVFWFKSQISPLAPFAVNDDRCVDFSRSVKRKFINYQVGFVSVDLGHSKHMMNTVSFEDGRFLFFDYFNFKFYSPNRFDIIGYYINY